MKTIKYLSINTCRANPGTIYVFGDNLIQRGKAGQALIRDEPNAYGIPTKRLPSMASQAFFSDRKDEQEAVHRAIADLVKLSFTHTIVFPEAGIGTGLARMEASSPQLFKTMNKMLIDYFE